MHMPRHLGRLQRQAALLAISSVLSGCGQAVISGHPGGHQATSPGGQVVSSAGQIVSDVGYQGPVLVSADRHSVTIGGGDLQYPCFGSLHPFATETTTMVELWLRYVTPAQHGPCRFSMARYRPTVLRLSSPLGSRELMDGATGRPLPWLGEWRILRPSAIPTGLRAEGVIPGGPTPSGQSSSGTTPPGCIQLYQSADYLLQISQSSFPFGLPAASQAPSAIEVRGLPGRGTVGDTVAAGITWREAGMYVEIVAEYLNSSGSPLTVQQLIAIANSAPPIPPN
jgi:hypothetical protein